MIGKRQRVMQGLEIGSAIDQKSELVRLAYPPAIAADFENAPLPFRVVFVYRCLVQKIVPGC